MAHALFERHAERLLRALALAALLCPGVYATPSRAQPDAAALLEPRDVEIVSGTVARVRRLPRAGGGGRDVMLTLLTDIGDDTPVAVAPHRVARAMGLRLRSGDRVQVAGWRIVRGKPALLAAEIRSAGRLFVFRDRYGNPLWRP